MTPEIPKSLSEETLPELREKVSAFLKAERPADLHTVESLDAFAEHLEACLDSVFGDKLVSYFIVFFDQYQNSAVLTGSSREHLPDQVVGKISGGRESGVDRSRVFRGPS